MERYWARVDTSGGPDACWPWTGGTFPNGYGALWLGNNNVGAHRYAYELANGPVPDGMTVDHTCHNNSGCALGSDCPHRACQNPRHMEAVPQKTNNARGNSVTAENAVKTHCPQNHPYDLENTYAMPGGGRGCRICRRAADHRWRSKRKVVA